MDDKKITNQNINQSGNFEVENAQKRNFIIKDHSAIFELSANANRLYDFYIAVSFNNSQSFYSYSKIASLLNISRETIYRATCELVEKGYISKTKRENASNLITILERS